MLILDWMKTNVLTVTPDTSLREARRIFRDKNINRLPVVDAHKLVVGLLSTADLKRYAPVNATGVEILETLEILDKTKVKEAMVPNPVTIHPNNTIEEAAQYMIDKHVSCLPVTDSAGVLVGIMTGLDVFKALLDLSGADQPGLEVGFMLSHKHGELASIIDKLRSLGVRIISVLTSLHGSSEIRKVKIRFRGESEEVQDKALELLRANSALRYWIRGGKFYMNEEEQAK